MIISSLFLLPILSVNAAILREMEIATYDDINSPVMQYGDGTAMGITAKPAIMDYKSSHSVGKGNTRPPYVHVPRKDKRPRSATMYPIL